MPMRPKSSCLVPLAIAAALTVLPCAAARVRADGAGHSAADVIREAVVARLGVPVDVAIAATGMTGTAAVFREARPDPSARIGGAVRFTLITTDGAAIPVSAVFTVTGDRVVARRDIARGETVARADLAVVHGDLAGAPLRRLPAIDEMAGGKALRAIASGATLLPGVVTVRRTIEPGEKVTATAAGGLVEVTAEFTAADGGSIGDVIRIVNPASHQYLRARIVRDGWVEVIDGR
jgi:flagella basal body P-ring formation protein FlgA